MASNQNIHGDNLELIVGKMPDAVRNMFNSLLDNKASTEAGIDFELYFATVYFGETNTVRKGNKNIPSPPYVTVYNRKSLFWYAHILIRMLDNNPMFELERSDIIDSLDILIDQDVKIAGSYFGAKLIRPFKLLKSNDPTYEKWINKYEDCYKEIKKQNLIYQKGLTEQYIIDAKKALEQLQLMYSIDYKYRPKDDTDDCLECRIMGVMIKMDELDTDIIRFDHELSLLQ